MTTQELPEDRSVLEYLRGYADRLLAVLVPALQQVKYAASHAADLLRGDTSEAAFSGRAVKELRRTVARGIPPHHALAGYLGGDLGIISQVPESELHELEGRIRSGTATAADRESHAALSAIRIAEYRDGLGKFVGRVLDLHQRIVERLAAHPAPPFATSAPPPGATEEPGAGAEVGDWGPHQTGTTTTKRARGRRRNVVSGVQPSSAADQRALGLDERKRWQLFQRSGKDWRHLGPFDGFPERGREWTLLKAFADSGGSLSRVELIRLVMPVFSCEDGRAIYNKIVKSSVSRLRARLRKELDLGSVDLIPWDAGLQGYRLLVEVGYSEKDDQHRPRFSTRDRHAT